MDFNQFVDEVKGGIKQFLPIEYEDAQVRIEEIKKLNENYLGITVLKENQVIAPTFNLNQLYEMFQSDPQNSMENILKILRSWCLMHRNSLIRRASQNMRMQRISCSSAYLQQKKMKKCCRTYLTR